MRQESREHKKIITITIILMLVALSIGMHKYLIDPYTVYDDQREIIEHVKWYSQHSYDNFFYSSPLYFLLYVGLSHFMPNLLVMKLSFLLIIPIFVIYAYNLGSTISGKIKYESLYFPALFPIVLSVFYIGDLMFGLQKAFAFSVFLGLIYYTVIGKKYLALLCLIIIAFIYPPLFIVGIGFSAFHFLFKSIGLAENKMRTGIFDRLKSMDWKVILPFLLVLILYSGYYLMVDISFQRSSADGLSSIAVTEKLGMDSEIEEEIKNTRTDFVPSPSKYFGVIPKQYFNDIRMGIFGEIGGTALWVILVALILVIWTINKKKFIVPDFTISLFLVSSSMFLLSHIFYNKLYYPNRYTKFTFPIIAVYLIVTNLPLSVESMMQKLYSLKGKIRYLFSAISVALALVFFYVIIYRKMFFFGTQYDRFDFTIFMIAIVSLLVLAIILFAASVVQIQGLAKFILVFAALLLVVLILNVNKLSSPVKVYDRELFPIVDAFGKDVSLCGYPEMMSTVHAFTSNPIDTNLGQGVAREDAYEFYNLLTAHYSNRLDDVYEYMKINNYDFLIVQKEYFHSEFTEDNNLFSFYPVLRRYENSLKEDNQNEFVLLEPPQDIIEFSSKKSIVISNQKLKNHLSFK